jgi:hypothetical protein
MLHRYWVSQNTNYSRNNLGEENTYAAAANPISQMPCIKLHFLETLAGRRFFVWLLKLA